MKKKIKFSTTQIIALGFMALIATGTVLLMLPAASANGTSTSFVDALFTATTSSCVTGLVVVNTLEHWSLFGHVVILFLIETGGLGVVTIAALFLIILGRRLSLSQRLLLQDAYNIDTLFGIVQLTRKVVLCSLVIQGIGAVFYMIRFIPAYGVAVGIWRSVFTAVSAFCNAGMDLVGECSLAVYAGDTLINVTTMVLIIVAGLGFPVWWDIADKVKRIRKDRLTPSKAFKKLSLQSKLVLTTTAGLILFGAVFILTADFYHETSLGPLSVKDKILAAFFQSVTVRTAGFETVPQAGFSHPSQIISMILMFVGGSPGGTAGGVKTVTMAVLFLSIFSILHQDKDTEAFGRRISDNMVRKALAVVAVSLTTLLVSIISLSVAMPDVSIMDVAYEATSAIATVGLTRGITGSLTVPAKIIIVLTMYAGRIGPISMALAFNRSGKNKRAGRQLPEENIMVG